MKKLEEVVDGIAKEAITEANRLRDRAADKRRQGTPEVLANKLAANSWAGPANGAAKVLRLMQDWVEGDEH